MSSGVRVLNDGTVVSPEGLGTCWITWGFIDIVRRGRRRRGLCAGQPEGEHNRHRSRWSLRLPSPGGQLQLQSVARDWLGVWPAVLIAAGEAFGLWTGVIPSGQGRANLSLPTVDRNRFPAHAVALFVAVVVLWAVIHPRLFPRNLRGQRCLRVLVGIVWMASLWLAASPPPQGSAWLIFVGLLGWLPVCLVRPGLSPWYAAGIAFGYWFLAGAFVWPIAVQSLPQCALCLWTMGVLPLTVVRLAGVADVTALGVRLLPQSKSWKWVLWGVLLMVGLVALRIMGLVSPEATPREVERFRPAGLGGPVLWIYSVLHGFLGVSIPEEMMFRCLMLGLLVHSEGVRPWPAILAVSVGFAALHGSSGLFMLRLLAGVILGWAYLRSGDLGVPIILHTLMNSRW